MDSGIFLTRKFIYTDSFRYFWKAMGLSDSDLLGLKDVLRSNPQLGNVIESASGVRKIRRWKRKHLGLNASNNVPART